MDLCGGFVVIDNDANVTMVHQTAREYLSSTNDIPFCIKREEAHKKIFLNCMRSLMVSSLRTKMKSSAKPVFVDYAAYSWSSHLVSTPLNDREVAEVLHKFLTSSWVLTWIQFLADSGLLRVLVQASKHLSRYSVKQSVSDTAQNEQGGSILRQELTKSWAEDLAKIVGRFHAILRQNPESIYKLIPPFCPQNSAIYQQFGNRIDRALQGPGLSAGNWSDLFARLSFEFGDFASSILAAGSQIAVLIPSGKVYLYNSSDFEQATFSPISHGERIYRMELNTTGTLLATYGYLTIKVWDLSIGHCKVSVRNINSRPRPLAMLLTRDNFMLLIGTDDRNVRSISLNEDCPAWQSVVRLEEPELEGHFLNAANLMAFNRDGSLIAVAYRGYPLSAWEFDGPVHISHCWRKREELARGEVIEAVWHPHDAELIGLYIEGVVFKWRPYEDEVDEIATGASKLAISRDGNLFATSDARGTVQVHLTSDFGLLYQLSSENTVFGLAFSPDLRRIYDIRGHYGNVWGPNALMRYADQRGQDSKDSDDTRSSIQYSTASESFSKSIDSITVLASSPAGHFYCYGTENGTVTLCDTQHAKLADLHTSRSFQSIEHMGWSSDGQLFYFCDSSKQLSILSISPNSRDSDPSVETKVKMSMIDCLNGTIEQLLFHPQRTLLLVRSTSTVAIISLTSFVLVKSLERHTAGCKWIIHPQESSLIVEVGPKSLQIMGWDIDNSQNYVFEYQLSQHESSSSTNSSDIEPANEPFFIQAKESAVDKVLVSHGNKHMLIQLSILHRNSKERSLLYFETPSCLAPSSNKVPAKDEKSPMSITATILSQDINSRVIGFLAFLPGDRLVLLSKTFSVCTWRLPVHSRSSMPFAFPVTGPKDTTLITTKMQTSTTTDQRPSDVGTKADSAFKLLFSLPGDWISRESLALCSVWAKERSLLCPRNGEVAVIRCSGLT